MAELSKIDQWAREYVMFREESIKARRARSNFLAKAENEDRFECEHPGDDISPGERESFRCFRGYRANHPDKWCSVCQESHRLHLAYHKAVIQRQQAYLRLQRLVLKETTLL